MADALIEVRGLRKEYRQGFWMRRVEAVRGVDFSVPAGAAFGFLGPNGAGKTSTIKVLMGLARATAGQVRLFGQPVPSPSTRRRVGYLPENPYIYPYLTPREFVRLSGSLSGLRGAQLQDRTESVLRKTGILYAAERPAHRLSKGMLQRTGLSAALVSDPELLVLDEPMSGLDPGGRREVRDLIVDERRRGRTLLVCTHILSDVPTLCDQVVIVQRGRVVISGRIDELLSDQPRFIELTLAGSPEPLADLAARQRARIELAEPAIRTNFSVAIAEGRALLTVPNRKELARTLAEALERGLEVVQVSPRRETLEELFLREALGKPVRPKPPGGAGSSAA